MIRLVRGSIFDSDAEALVNAVNTVGVMGKGLALQFKQRYPRNYQLYREACRNNQVCLGKMLVVPTNQVTNPKWIINFPTKTHWREPSQLSYIERGLVDLVQQVSFYGINSLAVPALGAGLGGLDWEDVKAMLLRYLSALNIPVTIYEPWPLDNAKIHI